MFSIDNILFFLTTVPSDFTKATQEKLIIPGIIFSIGAVMLIACVIVQNISRRKKLAAAEKLKRERIKKFSEEANMRYAPQETSEEDLLRQKRFLQQGGTIPGQQPQPKVAVPNPVPVQSQNNNTQNVPSVMNANIPSAPSVVPSVSTSRPMPNTINPAVPTQSSAPVLPNQTSNESSNTTIRPNINQPTMGGQVLPGMSAASHSVTTNADENNNIADLVKQRIKEIEEKKRKELAEQQNTNELPVNKNTTEETKPQASDVKPISNDIKEKIKEETKVEVKEEPKEEKKKFKFEYKPDYKPGQEPKEETKIEIPLTTENKNTEEKITEEKVEKVNEQNVVNNVDNKEEKQSITVNKIDFNSVESHDEESSETRRPIRPIKNLFNVDDDDEEIRDEVKEERDEKVKVSLTDKNESKELREENKNELSKVKTFDMDDEDQEEVKPAMLEKEEVELTKIPKVVVERSETFADADDAERTKIYEETKEEIVVPDRSPQVPKIVTKKVEYNAGYLREVQNKINSSREYKEAINIKEEEKEKLKQELFEKRMNLEKMKSKLNDEKQEKEASEKLTKEQISKSLLEKTEGGIVYEEGKKISLFDAELPKEEQKVEVKETTKEVHEEKIEETKQEEKTEIKNQNQNLNKNEQQEKHHEEKNNKKDFEKQQVEKQPVKKQEDLKTEITKENDNKKSAAVLNQLDYLFSSLDGEEKINPAKVEEEKIEKQKNDERTNREIQKDKIKEIVDKTKKIEIREQSNKVVPDDIKDKIKSVAIGTGAIAAGTIASSNIKEMKNDSDEEIDPIKAQIRAKVQEEKERKLREQKQAEEARLARQKPERTKSILEGVDLDKEILESKTNKVASFNDAPNFKKIICVVSPEDCGKTTVAVNLAYELANRGLKVCLIDTDNIKKDVYYYIHQDRVGCLSRLNEFDEAKDMYNVGINVNDRLTVFTENKGIEYEINYSKLYKLINYAHEVNDAVIIDIKHTLGQEKTKDLLKLSSNILMVIDKKITTLNRIGEKFNKVKGAFLGKDVTVVVNMDEGRGINKGAVKSIFKHLEYVENGERKAYQIKIGDMFTVMYDTKSIITGLISQQPAVTVKENSIIADVKKIANYYYENN